MRKTFTLIALLLGVNATQAQVAFPSSFAVWSERHGQGEAAPKFSIVGMKANDVTIGGTTYHKLYRSYDNGTFEETEYIGGIREEDGKIWYYNLSTSSEKLLYDFTVAVGDTVSDVVTGAKNAIVHSIETVTVGGVARKRINFRTFTSPAMSTLGSWLEGVGNTGLGGLLGSNMVQPTCDCATNAICFTQSSVEVYKNPNYPTIPCGTVVGTECIAMVNTEVSVVPNPVNGAARLQIPNGSKFSMLVVYNMAGQKVMTTYVEGAKEVAIDGNTMTPGIYMYQLTGDNNAASGKFIVE